MKLDMELLDEGKIVKIAELPKEIQEVLLKNDYEIDEEAEDTEAARNDDYFTGQRLRKIDYPPGVPIVAANFLLDGGMGINSYVVHTSNLTEEVSLDFIGVSAHVYEKQDPAKKGYIVYKYGESGEEGIFLVIEV